MTKLRIHKDYAAKAQARRNANDTRRPQWRTPRAHTIETKPESKLHETAEVRPQRRQLRRDRSKIHGDRSKMRLPKSVGPSRRGLLLMLSETMHSLSRGLRLRSKTLAAQLFPALHHTGACGPSRARPFVSIGRALWIRTMKIHLGELPPMDCSSQISEAVI